MISIRLFFIVTILFFSTHTVQAKEWYECVFGIINCSSEEEPKYNGVGSDFGANIGIEAAKELRQTIDDAIKSTGKENRKTLEKLREELDTLMQSAGDLYDNKLNLTVDKLDIVTTKKLQELEELINKTNSLLQSNISLTGEEARKTIQALSNVMTSVTRDIENIIVVGGVTGVYVVDRSTNNILSIIAFVMVGIGLLLSFIMFFRRGVPTGKAKYLIFTSMGSYLLLFSLMLFSPTLRAYAMSYSGIGLKKSINAEKLEITREVIPIQSPLLQEKKDHYRAVLVPEKEIPSIKSDSKTESEKETLKKKLQDQADKEREKRQLEEKQRIKIQRQQMELQKRLKEQQDEIQKRLKDATPIF